MNLYLISWNNKKFIVEAHTAQTAIDYWIEDKNREEREFYESKRTFKPHSFNIEELARVQDVIRKSE